MQVTHVKRNFRSEIFLLLLWIFSDILRAWVTNDAADKNNLHIHIINPGLLLVFLL